MITRHLGNLSESPVGVGLALLCWGIVLRLGVLTWQRERGDEATDLLIAGAPWLALRTGLSILGAPFVRWPGSGWLTAALDWFGLMLLIWPLLSPPLSARRADQLVGAGMMGAALMCGAAVWQGVRGALGLAIAPAFAITWANAALVLASVATLHIAHRSTRQRFWWVMAFVMPLVGLIGLLKPRWAGIWPSSTSTALFAAVWAIVFTVRLYWPEFNFAAMKRVPRREWEVDRLRAILEKIADGVIMADAEGRVILVNEAAIEMLGLERSDLLGKSMMPLIENMAQIRKTGIMKQVAEGSRDGEGAMLEMSGRVVQVSIASLYAGESASPSVVAVLRDVTALVEAEDERERLLSELEEQNLQHEEAMKKLRELDQLKSQFIANMSHELRTPLNAIIGFSGLMLKEVEGPLTDTQRTDLSTIFSSGKHLLGLINSILDISQIWAGKMSLNLSAMDLAEVIDEAMTIAESRIGDKSIGLVRALPSDLPSIWADNTRIRQVLVNLLVNAVKYTPEGQITVSASVNESSVTVSISDTGIGIPPEHQRTIFEAFSRVDNSSTRSVDGLGLGLSISQQLVELHDGEISVQSEPDVGSTFSFKLPIAGPKSGNGGKEAIRRGLRAAVEKLK